MYKTLGFLFFSFILVPKLLSAQILPIEGSELNYRRIGFSFPTEGVVAKYKIEIATGYIINEDSFKKHIVTSVYSKENRTITEVPYFGNRYTWKVTYTRKNAATSKSALHHFSTGFIPEIDTCNMRLRIIKPAVKYKDDFIFVDGNKALYNMQGDPVWYLPNKNKAPKGNPLIRDLKLSPAGTITFLHNEEACEINYNGDTLWIAPNNGSVSGTDSENYHHEFTRLSNGHYMVLGSEHVMWDHNFLNAADSGTLQKTIPDSTGQVHKKTVFGTVIEYDEKGNVVWSWKSSTYFMNSDLIYFKSNNKKNLIDVHENAFYFDEPDSVIYVSFKNISRILKIKYPEGNILASYGEVFKPNTPSVGNGLFCEQHACKKSSRGYLFLYNNNACNDEKALPKVMMLQEPLTANDSLTTVWEYECQIDDIVINPLLKRARERQRSTGLKDLATTGGITSMLHATNGGNVIELPDESVFVCMNTQYSKLFIVSKDKKILWSATPEKWRQGKNNWFVTPFQYKACIITPKELDQLIYNSMKP